MSHRHPFIEGLEGRRLLSASAGLDPVAVINPGLMPFVSTQAESKPAKAAKRAYKARASGDPVVRSTNLVGEWEGHMRVKWGLFGEFTEKLDLDISIYDQGDNFIRGEVEVDGWDYDGTYFGKINPKNGRFRFELDEGHDEIEIKGQLSKRGRIIGGGKIDIDCGWWKRKGSFEVDRIA